MPRHPCLNTVGKYPTGERIEHLPSAFVSAGLDTKDSEDQKIIKMF